MDNYSKYYIKIPINVKKKWLTRKRALHARMSQSTVCNTGDLFNDHTHTHTSRALLLQHFHQRFHYTHTQSSCMLETCLMMTHTYPCPRLIACTNTYFSFTFTGAFSLHAIGVTCKWRTYFTSVRRVFLVETVVLQTVLWDIRAWSARFLVGGGIIFCMSGERDWCHIQENCHFWKNIWKFYTEFSKQSYFCLFLHYWQ